MYRIKQIAYIAICGFRRWHKNPQIILCFLMAFVFCFLLSDKVMQFAQTHGTYLQGTEAFIWTFGDARSVFAISILLLLLFADMPNLSNEVPYFMIRINRQVWMAGQIVYLVFATFFFTLFVLVATILLSAVRSYPANYWSDTAAILGYSNIGENLAIPAFVKVMELTTPYVCTMHIFFLMTGYTVTMAGIILLLNLCKNNGGMIGGVIFSVFGIMMNPDIISNLFGISIERIRIANIISGWISPLNHATYYMHSFGYDNLPKLWQSYLFFFVVSVLLFAASLVKIKNYPFQFTGSV